MNEKNPVKKKKNYFQILHISDLHFDPKEAVNQDIALKSLIDRVIKDRDKHKFNPDMIAVTGDITLKGQKKGYDEAKKFFKKLLAELDLKPERLFIVPGNHDLDRDVYIPGTEPRYFEMETLNKVLKNPKQSDSLFEGLDNYFNFIKESGYTHLSSEHGRMIPFVSLPDFGNKKIGIIGLNSAWMCRDSKKDKGIIAVGQYPLQKALEELKEKGNPDFIIYMLHHPLEFLWETDQNCCRDAFKSKHTILLFGHVHKSDGACIDDLDGKIFTFQAGSSLIAEKDTIKRFQYVTFDFGKNNIRLNFRKRPKGRGKWIVDNEKCANGEKIFQIYEENQTNQAAQPQKSPNPIKQEKQFKHYATRAVSEYRHLPTKGFDTNLRQPIELERVYINMRANIQSHEMDFTMEGFDKQKRREQRENLSAIDIKTAFQSANDRKIKDMVILGDPGSGKTTLLKYILLMVITGKAEEKTGLDSGVIPFFAPLRELKNPDSETFVDFIKRVCWFRDYKITDDSFDDLMHSGQAIILLDGLDEVANEKARIRTCAWIDNARKKYTQTQFVITSRFAGYTEQSRLDGVVFELSIQDFTIEEARAFLEKWFSSVEVALHPGEDEEAWEEKGRDQAAELVKEIEKSKAIQKLAVNPLLLQIIALVRRDRGTKLPDRRVELYEECVDVLLEKWDMARNIKTTDRPLTAKEARQVLQPLALWLHKTEGRRHAPMEQIIKVIQGPLESIGKDDIDPKKMLLDIRDRSGLFMGYSETEYGFAHLGFQEYLAGVQIRNDSLIDLLVENYGDKWWREALLLSLALDSPSILAPFLEKIIPTHHFETDTGLVMDALRDSVIKPPEPFIDALKNDRLSSAARQNAAQALRHIGGKKAVQALKEATENQDAAISTGAFQVLETLDATQGIQEPVSDRARMISSERGSDMVLVPAGVFLYGSRDDDKRARSNEKPQRSIHLPDFYMDVHPVTNSQYSEFLNDKRPDGVTLKEWIYLAGPRVRIQQKGNGFFTKKGYGNHPATYVTWYGADAYATWAGKRLPMEEEWEKAARGTDGQAYPWGNTFDKKRCNSKENGIQNTTPIDAYPGGRSPYGCFDMSGNVWEWTSSCNDNSNKYKVLRGGSWVLGSGFCLCARRDFILPYVWDYFVGFRCLRT